MSGRNGLLGRAEEAFREARTELRKAGKTRRSIHVQDACGKAWLGITFANNALFAAKGISAESLPKGYRGIRYLLNKHAPRTLRDLFNKLYVIFHVGGYYSMTEVPPEAIQPFLKDLSTYLRQVKKSL